MIKANRLKISYIGYSLDHLHIADRRRFAHYCQSRQIELAPASKFSDILVVTPLTNLSDLKGIRRPSQKLILDMVDGYLNEERNLVKDIGRAALRSGFNLRAFKGYREGLRGLISECDAVVVGSPEQRELIEKMNSNVHVILDCHSEIPFLLTEDFDLEEKRSKIFWEGQSSNIKHLAPVANKILSVFTGLELAVITNPIHYRVADKFLQTPSKLYLEKKISREFQSRVDLIGWSIANLVELSRISKFGLIPINSGDPFAQAKPENKLLIMWRLGLPTLVSSTPAYDRVLGNLALRRYSVRNWNIDELSRESILDILAHWISDRRTVLDYLNETHSCSLLNQKWDQVIYSVGGSRGEK